MIRRLGGLLIKDPGKQGLNWYEYCNSNPLRNIDTNGCGFWDTVNNIAYAIVPGGYAWNKGVTAIFNGNYNSAAQWLALSFTQAGVCIYSAGLSSTLNQSSDAISASAETTASADSLGETSSSTATSSAGASQVANTPIGQVDVPSDLVPGTTTFGQAMHEEIGDWLKQQYPDTEFILNTGSGQTGVDVTFRGGDPTGWDYLEIKPQTSSGLQSFNNQLNKWGLSSDNTVALTYDYNGNLYWGW